MHWIVSHSLTTTKAQLLHSNTGKPLFWLMHNYFLWQCKYFVGRRWNFSSESFSFLLWEQIYWKTSNGFILIGLDLFDGNILVDLFVPNRAGWYKSRGKPIVNSTACSYKLLVDCFMSCSIHYINICYHSCHISCCKSHYLCQTIKISWSMSCHGLTDPNSLFLSCIFCISQ